ncbi:hypothetical protein [Candidatus Coxiella mudrowiae]|uniref:hypothetical protein n=1 Tax=Candidatus Coxiella mudrowiae TaxID=2054173 RepID=UPI000C282BA8|nr:hypothetical protein [Candidatus Coxiella mudrowiae]
MDTHHTGGYFSQNKGDRTYHLLIGELAGLIHSTIELISMAFDWSVIHPSQIYDHRYQRG